MDIIAPLLAADPAAPRLTTYTDAGRMELSAQSMGNWQAKVANLLLGLGVGPQSTVLVSAQPGWLPAVIAVGAWKVGAAVCSDPRLLALQGFIDGGDAVSVVFTDDLEFAESDAVEDSQVQEVFLLSADPFGRGVEESGGEVPFGITDFSPELRVQPDAFLGAELPVAAAEQLPVVRAFGSGGEPVSLLPADLREMAVRAGEAVGVCSGAPVGSPSSDAAPRVLAVSWEAGDDVAGLAECLSPLALTPGLLGNSGPGGSVVLSTEGTAERLEHLAASERARVWDRLS